MSVYLITLITAGCSSPDRSDENRADVQPFEWSALASVEASIRYVQLNFDQFPTDRTIEPDPLEHLDSAMTLTAAQVEQLQALVTDSSNFSEGDCGTFHLNAAIVVARRDSAVGIIRIGCGYNQWNFQPANPMSKWGGLNDRGFAAMQALLDDVNRSAQR